MPIDQASARVVFFQPPDMKKLEQEAYTGSFGAQGNAYTAWQENGYSFWKTTQRLTLGQGLTIVLSMPKGLINEPSFWMYIYYFIRDNGGIIWLLIGLLLALLYSIYAIMQVRRRRFSTIIPLFYPPENMSPAAVRYLNEFGYDHKILAAQIIHLAVAGYLTIESHKAFFTSSYTLKKTEAPIAKEDQPLMHRLFEKSDILTISQANNLIMGSVINWLRHSLSLWDQYFDYHSDHVMVVAGLGLISWIAFIMGGYDQYEYLFISIGFIVGLLFFLFYQLRDHTKLGQKLFDQIAGFKLFLATTEIERLKIIGTPPTRTPQLYEKYLPYAVALGVEEAWSAQFAPIFAQFAQQGTPYLPYWYIGSFDGFSTRAFASGLSSSIGSSMGSNFSAISSSSSAPGSYSGSDGGGSSGGGGGGGGGSSW